MKNKKRRFNKEKFKNSIGILVAIVLSIALAISILVVYDKECSLKDEEYESYQWDMKLKMER